MNESNMDANENVRNGEINKAFEADEVIYEVQAGEKHPRSSDSIIINTDVEIVQRDFIIKKDFDDENGGKPKIADTIPMFHGTIPRSHLAVVLEDVQYCYGKPKKNQFALQGVNINVPKGVIYALLGPSGCGKTTTLKALTRIIKPDTGDVRFPGFAKPPRIPGADVGYMPQELALFLDLTIEETLTLFASFHGISDKLLQERIESLIKVFDLPYKKRIVGTLSGGQKRRVSLATVLIHDPPIIILDEPTVGVDPLLRQTIWQYLIRVSRDENKTVILTTHYIDEAKDANVIGLMRTGKVLTESTPQELMNHFNEISLEACFYKICVMGEEIADDDSLTGELKEVRRKLSVVSGILTDEDNVTKKPYMLERGDSYTGSGLSSNKRPSYQGSYASNQNYSKSKKNQRPKATAAESFRRTKSLINKNIKLLCRDVFALFMQFALPAIEIALFGICVGRKVWDLPVAIVNDETPPRFSRQFLNQLDDVMIYQVPYDGLHNGIRAVEDGDAFAALYMRDNFTRCMITRIQKGLNVDNTTLDCSVVKMFMDTTNQVISTNLQDSIYKSFEKFQKNMLESIGSNPMIAGLPLQFAEPIHGSKDASFSEYVTPSIIMTTPYFLALALTGITLLLERRSGVFERLKVCGVSNGEVFMAQALTNTFVVIVQVLLMLLIQFACFETVLKGSIAFVIILTILQGLCGMVLGLFLSAIVDDVNTGIIIGVGVILYPSIFLCGIIWPLEGMPRVIRYVAYFVPATYSTTALRNIMSRGFGIDNPEVWLGVISVFGWSAIFLVSAMVIFRYRK